MSLSALSIRVILQFGDKVPATAKKFLVEDSRLGTTSGAWLRSCRKGVARPTIMAPISACKAGTMMTSSFEDGLSPAPAPAGAPILVVEDERELADEIRLELQASGHPVRLSETVDEAL